MKSTIMKFKENKGYSLLLLLVLLGAIIRLPITPHEIGADSFFIHSIANSISIKHQVGWSFNLGEIFELHPSHPPITVPLILSIFSQYIGLDVEKTILLFCIFLGTIGILSSYLMAREISKNRSFIFLVTFFFSFSPIFVHFTLWTVSTRGMFITLLPLFIWCFLRFENSGKRLFLPLAFLFFILLIPVHHMFALAFSIWGAYIVTKLYSYAGARIKLVTKYFPIHLPTILFILFISILVSTLFVANTFLETVTLNILLFLLILILWCVIFLLRERYLYFKTKIRHIPNYLPLIIPILLVFLFISLFLFQFFSGLEFFEMLKWKYQRGMFFTGEENYKIFLNMVVDYWSSEGILFPFAFIGLAIMIKNVNRNRKYLFLVLILLSCTIFSAHGEYMNVFLSPLFAVLVGLGLVKSTKKLGRYKRTASSFIVGCLIISILFSNFMTYHWTFHLANPPSKSTPWMQERTYNVALFLRTINSEGPIITNDGSSFRIRAIVYLPPLHTWRRIVFNPYSKSQELLSDNNVRYVIENRNFYGRILSGWSKTPVHSPFLRSIHEEKDKTYDNGLYGIWSLE